MKEKNTYKKFILMLAAAISLCSCGRVDTTADLASSFVQEDNSNSITDFDSEIVIDSISYLDDDPADDSSLPEVTTSQTTTTSAETTTTTTTTSKATTTTSKTTTTTTTTKATTTTTTARTTTTTAKPVTTTTAKPTTTTTAKPKTTTTATSKATTTTTTTTAATTTKAPAAEKDLTQADIDKLVIEMQEYSDSKETDVRNNIGTVYNYFGGKYNSPEEYYANRVTIKTPDNSSWNVPFRCHSKYQTYQSAKQNIKEWIDLTYDDIPDCHVVVYAEPYTDDEGLYWEIYFLR